MSVGELGSGHKWCDYSYHDYTVNSVMKELEAEVSQKKPDFLGAIFFELRTMEDGQLVYLKKANEIIPYNMDHMHLDEGILLTIISFCRESMGRSVVQFRVESGFQLQ